ncbi:ATP-binding protein [Anabaena sp. WFMT]|uniref:ATP-binding protein n=1 Tax=Anabaena sp. WFMT TaxID=3449730 RepID=UPI003F1F383A
MSVKKIFEFTLPMDIDRAVNFTCELIVTQTGKPLNYSEMNVLKGMLDNKTYTQIAELHKYSEGAIRDIGSDLLKKLSAALGIRITKKNLRTVIEQNLPAETQKITPSEEVVPFNTPDYQIVGRERLISTLIAKLQKDCRILLLTGITGIGKTFFADQLAVKLQRDFPQSLLFNFDHYQNRFDHSQNIDFASIAAQMLTGWGETLTTEERKDTQLLFNWVVTRLENNPYLLVIDSLEFILNPDSDFKDEYWNKFFSCLLSANLCQTRIIITSQDLPRQLYTIGSRYPTHWHCQLLKGLTDTEQLEFFKQARLEISTDLEILTYLKKIGAAYEGHPLALQVITGEIISEPFYGDVIAYWKKYGHEVEKVEKSQQEQQESKTNLDDDVFKLDRYSRHLEKAVRERIEITFKRLANDVPKAYLMLLLASVYSEPVLEIFYLHTLENLELDEEERSIVLNTLLDRYLIEEMIDDNHDLLLRQHNLIRSTAYHQLKKSKNRK